ncbi:hypothetical protein CRG98_030328 [Punica granatum]|uniref:Uncharacterized protein n=1 Tax=Punica granatum TaxID=22663 RepID=A0A2I0IZ73_PUNGR|nr:hypothetical protein CRG98_030328 [Punica granatum]
MSDEDAPAYADVASGRCLAGFSFPTMSCCSRRECLSVSIRRLEKSSRGAWSRASFFSCGSCVLVKNDKKDDASGDYFVEYAVRNIEWTHGKSPCIERDPWGAVRGGCSFFGSPVITTMEWLDHNWGLHKCTFLRCEEAETAVLGKALRARSHGTSGLNKPNKVNKASWGLS